MRSVVDVTEGVIRAVADNHGSSNSLRALMATIGSEWGPCCGLLYGLWKDGRFGVVSSFGLDSETVEMLDACDPRSCFSPNVLEPRVIAVQSDLATLLGDALPRFALEMEPKTVVSIPIEFHGVIAGCLVIGFFEEKTEPVINRDMALAIAFSAFHVLASEPHLVVA